MYREMRRKDRMMPPEQARELLEQGEYGILSTVGGDGQPYATPLSYWMEGEVLYFHCAKAGQKLDNLVGEPRACFCVVGETKPVHDGGFTTLFTSVIAYGRAELVEEEEEKHRALFALCQKYLPEHINKAEGEIAAMIKNTAVVKLQLEHITGKQRALRKGNSQ